MSENSVATHRRNAEKAQRFAESEMAFNALRVLGVLGVSAVSRNLPIAHFKLNHYLI